MVGASRCGDHSPSDGAHPRQVSNSQCAGRDHEDGAESDSAERAAESGGRRTGARWRRATRRATSTTRPQGCRGPASVRRRASRFVPPGTEDGGVFTSAGHPDHRHHPHRRVVQGQVPRDHPARQLGQPVEIAGINAFLAPADCNKIASKSIGNGWAPPGPRETLSPGTPAITPGTPRANQTFLETQRWPRLGA